MGEVLGTTLPKKHSNSREIGRVLVAKKSVNIVYIEPARLPGHIFQASYSISLPLSLISAPYSYFTSANSAVKDIILIVNDSGFGSAIWLRFGF